MPLKLLYLLGLVTNKTDQADDTSRSISSGFFSQTSDTLVLCPMNKGRGTCINY